METTLTPAVTFDVLVDQFSRELFRYLWRILQDEQNAEDCLQDTFLRAYKAFGNLQHHDNLRAWLYKIATNVARTHLKRASRNSAAALEQIGELSTPEQGPEELAVQSSELLRVRQMVLALPERQRAALVLYRYHDLPYSEIAHILQISEDAARANVYQAHKKLRQQVATKDAIHD